MWRSRFFICFRLCKPYWSQLYSTQTFKYNIQGLLNFQLACEHNSLDYCDREMQIWSVIFDARNHDKVSRDFLDGFLSTWELSMKVCRAAHDVPVLMLLNYNLVRIIPWLVSGADETSFILWPSHSMKRLLFLASFHCLELILFIYFK